MAVYRSKLNLFSWKGNIRTLHLTWIAFFISFYVWFNHAALMTSIKTALGLTDSEVNTILILNVALTIPARVIVGMLVDKYGPRIMYSLLLGFAAIPTVMFAFADSFTTLAIARALLGLVGAGFVVGIRLIGEWFPAKQVGIAEGIYGGWGNFGSAAAAMSLPTIALLLGGENGWRYALVLTGVISFVYAIYFFISVSDAPKGSTYFKAKKMGALEVTSTMDFYLLVFMQAPLYACLALLTWKLTGVGLLSVTAPKIIYPALVIIYAFNVYKMYVVNREVFSKRVPEVHQYSFKQVAILDVAYFVTFGSELAVVSMLPLFFLDIFSSLNEVTAGLLASGFAFMNLIARPGGGLLSDMFGRKKTLSILITGLAVGYFTLSTITASWPVGLAVIATMMCSFFVQAGEGAVFAMVPLIKRRLTGQIAGMVGAYGNVGAVTYLTVFAVFGAKVFFMVIGVSALVTLLVVQLMDEPEGQIAEILPDGTVQLIDVS